MVLSLHEPIALVVWLAQGTVAHPDSALHVPISATTGVLGTLTNLANALVSLALIILVVAMVPAAVGLRKAAKKASALIDRLSGEVSPLVQHATSITDNVDFITSSIREDVRELSRTVRHVTDRVTNGLEVSEQRVAELGALLRLAQDELEDAVVSTAATLRGMRAGVTSLRSEPPAPRTRREQEEALENEEESDHDYRVETRSPKRGAGGAEERPQIRRRPSVDEGR